jgi:hypothetical protein
MRTDNQSGATATSVNPLGAEVSRIHEVDTEKTERV